MLRVTAFSIIATEHGCTVFEILNTFPSGQTTTIVSLLALTAVYFISTLMANSTNGLYNII